MKENKPKVFDTKTHHRNKDGSIKEVSLYKLICEQQSDGSVVKHFERPVGSGMFYFENGELDHKKSAPALAKEKPIAEIKIEKPAEKPAVEKK